MKINYYIVIALLFCTVKSTVIFSQNEKHCGTTEVTQELLMAHPELIQEEIKYNNMLQQQIESKKQQKAAQSIETVYIIPIVFHVIHINGSENISDAQIQDQVNILNRDYRKLNADTSAIVAGFDSIAADIKIEFRLARLDPNGNCTNGIDRIYSHRTIKADDNSKLNPWPRDKYLNVWTVNTIGKQGVAGYAYYPSAVSGYMSPYDGIIILSDYIGSIGTSAPYSSRALTHEIGHWLSLQHPWGNNNDPGQACGDDLVTDTPETRGHTSCMLTDTTCSKEAGINPGIIENVQNYMDYSYCSVMFTKGQRERMRTALESYVSGRNNLPTSTNLAATGTDGNTTQPCVPKPEFFANRRTICAGGSVTFSKFMLNASSTSASWSFPGGTPATSNAASPAVTYSTPGTYDVTLMATNSAGTDTTVKNMYIRVYPDWADFSGLVSENFEDNNRFFNYWMVNDLDNNENTWYVTADAGYNSNQSVLMRAFTNYAYDIDELYSPAYDLSFVNNATLTFRCAGASTATAVSDLNDALKVYSSNNCGQSWTTRATIQGDDLINNGYQSGYFIPNDPNQWVLHTITIPANATTENVRFKFEYTTGNASNNIYIDDLNINGTLSIDDKDINENSVSIYPNPSNKNSTIFYHLNERMNTKIEVVDILGNKVQEIINNDQEKGDYSFVISKQDLNLKNGLYFIKFSANNSSITKKLIFTE